MVHQPGDTNAKITALFELVADRPYDGNESDWDAVMELLNLPLSYQPAVLLALRDAHWKSATNPKAYVATVAFRIALKNNLRDRGRWEEVYGQDNDWAGPLSGVVNPTLDEDGKEMSYEDQLDRLTFDFLTVHGDYVWEEPVRDRVPDWLRDSDGEVDWDRVAEFAVRKESMADAVGIVLQLQAIGMSREKVLATEPEAADRRDLQAAYRWVDRNWETRIVPLFRCEQPPQPGQVQSNQTPKKALSVRPSETIKRACARTQPRIG